MIEVRAKAVSCAFTGHRPEKLPWGARESDPRCDDLKSRIGETVELAYEQGFRHFLCGMARGSDMWFCEAVFRLCAAHPEVSVEAVIPYPGQADRWSEPERRRYQSLLERCHYRTVVQSAYSSGCMYRRNRYLVDHAALLIAVHDGLPGGTRQTIEYAIQCRTDIVDIPPVLSRKNREIE